MKETKGKMKELEYRLIDSAEKVPKEYTRVALTKHATQNEKQLIPQLNKKTLLMLGNNTFGLTEETRSQAQQSYRLTPHTKKPLKANQALSYVLGLRTAAKLL